MFCRLSCVCFLLVLVPWIETVGSLQQQQPKKKQRVFENKQCKYDYDMIVLGAGAGGLFASGAASSLLGKKTALIELVPSTDTDADTGNYYNVGGDCTNAACVPSKAVRSMARQAAAWQRTTTTTTTTFSQPNNEPPSVTNVDWGKETQRHVAATVTAVRNREDPERIRQNPNLDLLFVTDCRFLDAHTLQITEADNIQVLTSRQFLITTGASPIVPVAWKQAAAHANNLKLWTYRSILRPDDTGTSFWDWLRTPVTDNEKLTNSSSIGANSDNPQKKRLLIVGGGATACELGQSVARLAAAASTATGIMELELDIELVAPAILPQEDVTLQRSALNLLVRAGIKCRLGERVQDILPDQSIRLSNGSVLPPFDALLVCIGRSPCANLETLQLDQAGVAWDPDTGVLVHTRSLQSTTAPNVYAAGDCSSAITGRSRTAAHAAWSGFHAIRNTAVPWILRVGSRSVHPTVPRVIYTDPELASVGLTLSECLTKYGRDGFDCLYVPEEGSDRADMERRERDTLVTFVELRAARGSGRILGCTACGPAAAELVNGMGMAIINRLTVRDVAQSMYSYPSHGYLLHRVALSMALSNVRGLLSACGPVGEVLGAGWSSIGSAAGRVRSVVRLPSQRKQINKRRDWEAQGASRALYLLPDASTDGATASISGDDYINVISFLDVFSNATLRSEVEATAGRNVSNTTILLPIKQAELCLDWLQEEP